MREGRKRTPLKIAGKVVGWSGAVGGGLLVGKKVAEHILSNGVTPRELAAGVGIAALTLLTGVNLVGKYGEEERRATGFRHVDD